MCLVSKLFILIVTSIHYYSLSLSGIENRASRMLVQHVYRWAISSLPQQYFGKFFISRVLSISSTLCLYDAGMWCEGVYMPVCVQDAKWSSSIGCSFKLLNWVKSLSLTKVNIGIFLNYSPPYFRDRASHRIWSSPVSYSICPTCLRAGVTDTYT